MPSINTLSMPRSSLTKTQTKHNKQANKTQQKQKQEGCCGCHTFCLLIASMLNRIDLLNFNASRNIKRKLGCHLTNKY